MACRSLTCKCPCNIAQKKHPLFGWNLLYETIAKDVDKKSDVLIAFLHFLLTRHCKFRCIGLGANNITVSGDEYLHGSDLLPSGWNAGEDKYALRYFFYTDMYVVLGYKTEDSMIINLLNISAHDMSQIVLSPDEIVRTTRGRIHELIWYPMQLVERYRREIIEPVFPGTAKDVATQTATEEQRRNPMNVSDHLLPEGDFMPDEFCRTGIASFAAQVGIDFYNLPCPATANRPEQRSDVSSEYSESSSICCDQVDQERRKAQGFAKSDKSEISEGTENQNRFQSCVQRSM